MPNQLLARQYAELHCKTNYSFLTGASHPGESVSRADELGYQAIAVTDRNSLAGVVQAFMESRNRSIRLLLPAKGHHLNRMLILMSST